MLQRTPLGAILLFRRGAATESSFASLNTIFAATAMNSRSGRIAEEMADGEKMYFAIKNAGGKRLARKATA